MNAKDKAKELIDKYWSLQWQVHKTTKSFKKTSMSISAAKQCAKIAVAEILKELPSDLLDEQERIVFWNEVKKEIELL